MIITHYELSYLEVIVPFFDCIIYAVGFLFCGAPFALHVCEGMWKKSYWKFCSIMFLWWLCSTGITWCVCVYYVTFCGIWIAHYRCLDNWFLECHESIVMGGCPLKFCLLASQECQRLGYFGEVPDKFPIISNESKKCAYFFGCFWWMHVFYGLSFLW